MYAFDYDRPDDLASARAALAEDGAQAIAGGQTLIPVLKQRLAMPARLVDLTGIDAIKGIRRQGDTLTIGATTTHAMVASSSDVRSAIPAIATLAHGIGDPQVRNRGTIGGSLANNDPAACYPAAVLACGAHIETDRREIAAEAFFDGLYTTTLEEGEIVTSVSFRIPATASYKKFEQPASRFALVGVFVARSAEGVRVAVTGAGDDGVFRHDALERALSAEFSIDAVDRAEVSPSGLSGDLHATPEYRAHLIKVLTRRAVREMG